MDCRTQVLPCLPPRWPDKSLLSAAPHVATPVQILVTTLGGDPALLVGAKGSLALEHGSARAAVPSCASPELHRRTLEQTSAPSKVQWWVWQTPAQQKERRQLRLGGLEEAAEPPSPKRADSAWPQVPPTHGLPCKVQDGGPPCAKPWSSLGGLWTAPTLPRAPKYRQPLPLAVFVCLVFPLHGPGRLTAVLQGPRSRSPLERAGGRQAKLLLRQKGLVPALGPAAACAPGVVRSGTCSCQT